MALTYRTAGESHGPALYALIEGLPAGLYLVQVLRASGTSETTRLVVE